MSLFLTIFSAIFSSILTNVIAYIFFVKKRENEAIFTAKSERYYNLISHMSVLIDSKNLKFINHKDPETGKQLSSADHKDFIKHECNCMQLYFGSDNLQGLLKKFVDNPNDANFELVISEMRFDLFENGWAKIKRCLG